MKFIVSILVAMLCISSMQAQTVKSLMYNTNGQVVYSGTNPLAFTSNVLFNSASFSDPATTRGNLGAQPTLVSGTNIKTINGNAVLGGGDLVITFTDASTLTNFPSLVLQTNSSDGFFPLFLLRTNGSANALTNFPSSVLLTNSATASFPSFLLRTNGSAAGLTDFPTLNQNTTGTASNVTGVVALANGGTAATNAGEARTNLGLGATWLTNTDNANFRTAISAAAAIAGDPSQTAIGAYVLKDDLTFNDGLKISDGIVTISVPNKFRDALGLPLPALTNTNNANFRTAIGLGSAATSASTDFQAASTNLTALAGNNAVNLTNFPAFLLRTNGSAAGLTNFPILNQNTTGTASNVTGVVALANGGTAATNAGEARTNLGLGSLATQSNITPSDLSSQLNSVAMFVSGAGMSSLDGIYFENGTQLGFPKYKSESGAEILKAFFPNEWRIISGGEGRYSSGIEVPSTPDLVTNWTVLSSGLSPAPTVIAISNFPTSNVLASDGAGGARWLDNVTLNSVTFSNAARFAANNLRINSSLATNNTNFVFGGVGGTIEVEANNNHAVVATARQITDGSAFYGYSSSGAHVAKFVQQTNFTSPAVTIWRDSTNASKPSEAFLIADSKGPTNTNMAINVRAGGTSVMSVDFQGKITSQGGYTVPVILGVRSALDGPLPTNNVPLGAIIIIYDGDRRIHIWDGIAWRN